MRGTHALGAASARVRRRSRTREARGVSAGSIARRDPPSQLLSLGVDMLTRIIAIAPGHAEAHLLLARCYFVQGNFEAAER